MKPILSICLLFLSLNIYSFTTNLNDQAKFYITRAYKFYKQDNFTYAKENLDKAVVFSTDFPEIHYLSIVLSNQTDYYRFYFDATKILELLNSSFIISKYELIKAAINIFKRVKDLGKVTSAYKSLFSIDNIDFSTDYIEFFDYLFWTNNLSYNLFDIEEFKTGSLKYLTEIDLLFYETVIKVFSKTIDSRKFSNAIKRLSSNGYSLLRIIYLESIYYESKDEIVLLTERFIKNINDKSINVESRFILPILKNLIEINLPESSHYISLLNLWIEMGGLQNNFSDKIPDMINDEYISANLEIGDLLKKISDYSGLRGLDADFDGIFEVLDEYKAGVLISRKIDSNQMGINQFEFFYYNYIVERFIQHTYPSNKIVSYFNTSDGSLFRSEVIIEDVLVKEFVYHPSLIFFENNDFEEYNPINYLKYIDYIRDFDVRYTITKYNGGIPIYTKIDERGDRKGFQSIAYYNNNIVDRVETDFNTNGIFEKITYYNNERIEKIKYMTDEASGIYDYLEVYNLHSIKKYWDINNDNKFDFYEENFDLGYSRLVFLADESPGYSFYYHIENNKITLYNNKDQVVSSYEKKISTGKMKGYTVVSYNKIPELLLPSEIKVLDQKSQSGIFFINRKQYGFSNGIITLGEIKYRLFVFLDIYYLIQITELK